MAIIASLCLMLFGFAGKASAQFLPDVPDMKGKMIYGGNFGLGMSGNYLSLSIAPQVGYRIFSPWEVGVRLIYDLDWNYRPECTTYNEHFVRPNEPMPKPKSLDQMLKAASILSKGFPEVRVDFYDINGKPYFGEMTFTAATGTMSNYSQDFLNELGSKVDLSKAKPLNH